jgi:regulator of protease activity HflC (stomatin/prohibitin superfamily)
LSKPRGGGLISIGYPPWFHRSPDGSYVSPFFAADGLRRAIIRGGHYPWGIKVSNVEVKHIDLPTEMQRAMAKQAEAERERRAKVINAEGEFQAATKLAEAAGKIQDFPYALQLRYLQTLREVSAENNSTTLFPIPIDLFKPFLK